MSPIVQQWHITTDVKCADSSAVQLLASQFYLEMARVIQINSGELQSDCVVLTVIGHYWEWLLQLPNPKDLI